MIKMVLPLSRPAASECPPDIRSSWVQIPYNSNKKRPIAKAIRRFWQRMRDSNLLKKVH